MVWLVVSLSFAILVAAFALQNAAPVVVRFLGWHLETSLAILLIGAAVAGALATGMLAVSRQLGMGLRLLDERSRAHRAEARAEQLRQEADGLRRELERLQAQGGG